MSGWRQVSLARKVRRADKCGQTVKVLALLKRLGEDVGKWKPRSGS